MNVVFKPQITPVKSSNSWFHTGSCVFCVFLIGVAVALYFTHVFSSRPPEEVQENPVQAVTVPEKSIIGLVADSYDIPAGYMERLAEYLADKSRFHGIGLFSVRQEDLDWIQDKVLLETNIDLTNDMQNAQVAAYLLKRFYDSGYSWRESFLIYTFGFSAVHDNKHEDFVSFMGF